MHPAEERRERLILFCVPVLIVLLGCGVSLLPRAVIADVLDFATAWACLSIPLAVLFGHCALSED
ncbi:MAG TPA: hypothetical protein VND19_19630 [Acetobacteraceae bacterium]|nr:hypothetical protein [Acetobacteraceae bacterium]